MRTEARNLAIQCASPLHNSVALFTDNVYDCIWAIWETYEFRGLGLATLTLVLTPAANKVRVSETSTAIWRGQAPDRCDLYVCNFILL